MAFSAAFFGVPGLLERVYGEGRRKRLEEQLEASGYTVLPGVVTKDTLESQLNVLSEVQLIFSTWGMWAPTEAQLGAMPKLKAVFYAAGTVQDFARPFLKREVTVVSAWAANAVPVAQWTLGQILLANKGYFRNEREFRILRSRQGVPQGRGNFGATVALLGGGQIGRRVLELLRPFDLEILVFDPFLPADVAREMGAEKVELHDAFSRGAVVSNHLANLPETVGMLRGEHFRAMPVGATFINTGRGATVREAELIEVLKERDDLTALLDVTHPEPPAVDSPLWELPNAFLTSHIAGSIGDEVVRMADYMIEEFSRYERGESLRYAVTEEMLEKMA